jgi:hypothetical protein
MKSNKKKSSIIKWSTISAIVLAVLLALVLVGANLLFKMTYSSGNRVGTVVKFSERGVFFKTWEGDVAISSHGFTNVPKGRGNPGAMRADMWQFSVTDESIVEKIDEAQTSNHEVKLHYRERFFTLPWKGDTAYIVDNVEVIRNKE